jgi:hypothetical protein
MTVKELIQKLQAMPQEADVVRFEEWDDGNFSGEGTRDIEEVKLSKCLGHVEIK